MNSNLILRWRGGYVKKKEVDCDPNAVRVRHLVEFLRGEKVVDSSCTNGDLLCFALHMIMMDSGYQPNVSYILTPSHTQSLTHVTTHTLTHSLTHSHTLTHTLTHSLTHSLTHPHTPSLTHTLTHTLTHPHTHTLTHSLIHSLTHSHTHSLTHCRSVLSSWWLHPPWALSLTHSHIHCLTAPLCSSQWLALPRPTPRISASVVSVRVTSCLL